MAARSSGWCGSCWCGGPAPAAASSGPRRTSPRCSRPTARGAGTQVATDAPGLLARPSDGGDKTWRPALELALGHSLVEIDRPEDAIAHLERGLLLQSALRRAQGGSDVPESADAKFRHLLGWAYAQTGRTAQARREYRRVLDIPGLDPAIRVRVEASLDALDTTPD